MLTPEIIQFIKSELSRGTTKELITNQLKKNGWTDLDINEAFNAVSPTVSPTVSPVASPSLPLNDIQATQMNTTASVAPSHKKLFIGLGIVVVLLLSSLGFFGYTLGYFISLDNVFSQSVQKSKDSAGANFSADMTVDISGYKALKDMAKSTSGISDISTFNFKGSYNTLDKKNIKSSSSLAIKSGTFDAALDSRILDGSLYVILTKAPDLGFFSLKPFENKWIVFPYKSSSGDFTPNPALAMSGFNENSLNKITDEQKQYIYNLTQNAHFVKITNKHLPVILNGTLSFHFDFDLDREGIVKYMKDLTSYLKTINIDNSGPLSSDTDLNKGLDSVRDFHGEAWVGILDHLPRKTTVNANLLNPDKPDDGVVKFAANIVYDNWNNPTPVEAPQNSVTLEKLISSIMGERMGNIGNTNSGTPEVSFPPDNVRRSTMSNMRAQAELFYSTMNNSYKGYCSSRGEYGAYKLAKGLPPNTVYKCNDANSSWAAWAKLESGYYWCSDSTGFSSELEKGKTPNGTSCSDNIPCVPDPNHNRC